MPGRALNLNYTHGPEADFRLGADKGSDFCSTFLEGVSDPHRTRSTSDPFQEDRPRYTFR
jgi:hypothetical protein